ncbi:hypothetical protein [Bacillus swezeyi]|uniref:hypothetical protein n=1 Tax=Bacillus swezeyi TaxID=1925020 RepID=UPI0011E8F936|nr:hypothetical protein [Bacillus swezeyi]KAA6475879.1 hypothetical protein DX928_07190 [Bacillus swezeyi]TYS38891.1 hypothetical protein FZC77_04710 [Bacillus swezeyi]
MIQYHDIDISDKEYTDYQLSEEVHQNIYARIKTDKVKTLSFPYDEKTLKSKIDFIFGYDKKYEQEKVLFYPSAFGYYSRGHRLYLQHPIAIIIPLRECKKMMSKLMLDMHDDLSVISETFKFGFVLSEDEYSNAAIEYWDLKKSCKQLSSFF